MKQEMYIVAFPLEHAYLCVNCENLGNVARTCPVCQSEQLINVAKILNVNPETVQKKIEVMKKES